jgi:TfoX/Sxy family transcriptional regulator of competence genes
MASDPALIERLHKILDGHVGVEPRRMFGGVCFMLNGNMCLGVHKTDLMLRVGEEQAAALLRLQNVRPMDLTGKVMKGWATVLPEAVLDDDALRNFVGKALAFVATLPRKEKKAARPRSPKTHRRAG